MIQDLSGQDRLEYLYSNVLYPAMLLRRYKEAEDIKRKQDCEIEMGGYAMVLTSFAFRYPLQPKKFKSFLRAYEQYYGKERLELLMTLEDDEISEIFSRIRDQVVNRQAIKDLNE
jgi:hypothetical protein